MAKEYQRSEWKSGWIGLRREYLEGEEVGINSADSPFKKVGSNGRGS